MSAEALNRSVVALIRSAEALNRSAVALIRSAVALIRSAVALIRSVEALIRGVPAHVVTEVPCHLIPGLRHSYDYMYSETSYLIIGAWTLPLSLRRGGEVRYIFHLLLSYLDPF